MRVSNKEQKLKYFVLFIIPIFILFAIDGTFGIQSIIIPIIFLIFIDVSSGKITKSKQMFITFVLFFIASLGSLIYNMFFDYNLLSNLSYIRIVYYIIILYMYFSLTSIKYDKKQLKKVFLCNVIVGVIISLFLIFINHIWYTNLIGTLMDKNFIGAILAIDAELSLINFYKATKNENKIIHLIFYAIILLGIFYSASRASLLVVILGTVLIFFFNMLDQKKSKSSIIKFFLLLIIVPLIGILLFNFISNKVLSSSQNMQWYWNRYFVNDYSDDSVVGRVVWWKKAIDLWNHRPLFGYGIGNVSVSGNSSAVAHNTYLDFLVDQGIIGFIAFIIIIYRSYKKLLNKKIKIYYPLIITLSLNILILSATRSTYLWYTLILIYSIGNSTKDSNKLKQGDDYEKND